MAVAPESQQQAVKDAHNTDRYQNGSQPQLLLAPPPPQKQMTHEQGQGEDGERGAVCRKQTQASLPPRSAASLPPASLPPRSALGPLPYACLFVQLASTIQPSHGVQNTPRTSQTQAPSCPACVPQSPQMAHPSLRITLSTQTARHMQSALTRRRTARALSSGTSSYAVCLHPKQTKSGSGSFYSGSACWAS